MTPTDIPIVGGSPKEIPILEEQVPIPVDKLAAVKKKLTDSEQLAGETSAAGVTLAKMVGMVAQLGIQAQALENEIRLDLREIIVAVNVKPEEFRGFDFDKGVVRIQRGGQGDTGTTGQGTV